MPVVLTAGIYGVLVLVLWLPFGHKSGLGYETNLVYVSETSSFWHGFFYLDPLREYTSVFYNLGYHLSAGLGIGGSFLGFQIVYAALWWARGFLAYLIVDGLFPQKRVLSFLVGALVLVHASDHALNWVGQLNQFGMIFWTLLSLYLLVLALKARTPWGAALLTVSAMLGTRMSLWSYESQLFIILTVPVSLLALRFGWTRRTSLVVGAYYLVPIVYLWVSYRRYAQPGRSSYQEAVLRDDMSLGPMLEDLWFNVTASVQFWHWRLPGNVVSGSGAEVLLAIGGAIVVAAGVAVMASLTGRPTPPLLPDRRTLTTFLGVGVVLLVLSFPAYLVLSSARTLWRTQFLSGIGFAVGLGSAIALLATLFRRQRWRIASVSICLGAIAYFGVAASFAAASYHYEIWSLHRTAVAEILAVAPRVEPETLVVLTDVPKANDPFRDYWWFDFAVRLAYPHVAVRGIYYYADGTAPAGQNMDLSGSEWIWNKTGFESLVRRAPFQNTIFIRYSDSGVGFLARNVPAFIEGKSSLDLLYAPAARIQPGPPPASVRRRYGPIPGW
jgi:hypothetical protein